VEEGEGMEKLLCFIFGHKYIKRAEKDNGYSLYGDMLCRRCGHVHNWQYDYNIGDRK